MDYRRALALPCIGHERADLVVAGCAILEAIMDIWPAEDARRRRPRHPRGHPALADGPRRLAVVRPRREPDGPPRQGPPQSRSTRWLERQLNDPYVQRAKAEGTAAARPTSCSSSTSGSGC